MMQNASPQGTPPGRPGQGAAILAILGEREAAVAREIAEASGLEVHVAESLSGGLVRLSERSWAATLISFSLEWMDLETAKRIADAENAGLLLVGSPAASLELTIAVRRAGGILLREPFDRDRLEAELGRVRVRREDPGIPVPEAEETVEGRPILGSGPRMMEIFQLIAQVADSSATILLTGESGTGKELFARAIHDASSRIGSSFVAVNCAAIPEHLLESELFGHERGAFTGAVDRLVGRFERADGGTLLLDEIGDMSLVLQAKVLRALEEREVERLGGASAIPVDVRVVAATNRSLTDAIEQGEFREDLYHRLAVVRVDLPPLREREEDLEELALHFAATFATRYGRPVRFLSRAALQRLRAHAWPGNVRELRNVMDRAVLLARGDTIHPGDLGFAQGPAAGETGSGDAAGPSSHPDATSQVLSLAEAEAKHIEHVLLHTEGHMGRAAEILAIHRNTLTRKVKEYRIDSGSRVAK